MRLTALALLAVLAAPLARAEEPTPPRAVALREARLVPEEGPPETVQGGYWLNEKAGRARAAEVMELEYQRRVVWTLVALAPLVFLAGHEIGCQGRVGCSLLLLLR